VENIIRQIQNEGKIKVGYLSAFFLLLFSFSVTFYTNKELITNAEKVEHTNQVISNLENILSAVKDAETGLRGYFSTGDVYFLDPYFGSRRAADSIIRETSTILLDNKDQVDSLESLRTMVKKEFAYIELNIKSFNANNRNISETLKDSMYESKLLMDSMRNAVTQMRMNERLLLKSRNRKLDKTSDALLSIVIASVIIAFFLVVFGFSTHLAESKKRSEAQLKVLNYQKQLQTRIDQLARANIELIRIRSLEKFAATGRIARTIAHEIRNPLTNINLAADQLKTELAEQNEEAGFLFDMINRNSQRINLLISDLMNSTKFTELNIETLTMNELAEEALKEAEDRIQLNAVTLLKELETNMPAIRIDKGKMKIALLNIIINGLESMEGKAEKVLKIETGFGVGENKCFIKITDTGSGMNEESLSRLFEPYFTTKQKGNGLGMTNTQNIVLNHKGSIQVNSEPGLGTTFTISLDNG